MFWRSVFVVLAISLEMRHFLPQTTLEMAKTAKSHQFANFNISEKYQRRRISAGKTQLKILIECIF